MKKTITFGRVRRITHPFRLHLMDLVDTVTILIFHYDLFIIIAAIYHGILNRNFPIPNIFLTVMPTQKWQAQSFMLRALMLKQHNEIRTALYIQFILI